MRIYLLFGLAVSGLATCVSGQQSTITSLDGDGTIAWTHMPTNCVAIIEQLSPTTSGDWITVYARIPTNSVSQTQLSATDEHGWFRAVCEDSSGAPTNMVLIPGGAFLMGDNLGDGDSIELPVHTVYVSPFYLDRYEVTNDEMVQMMQWAYDRDPPLVAVSSSTVQNAHGTVEELLDLDSPEYRINWNGSIFVLGQLKGAGYPCVEVSWYGAAAYCNYRSLREGLTPCYDMNDWSCDWGADGYRLPTEAEWEKGARGGLNGQRFPWGDYISHDRANYYSYWSEGIPYFWYDTAATRGHHPDYADLPYPYANPVGSFPPNGYRLYDMAGNVREWCGEGLVIYPSESVTDPHGHNSAFPAVRGSSWGASATFGRCACRSGQNAYATEGNLGFRCARSL